MSIFALTRDHPLIGEWPVVVNTYSLAPIRGTLLTSTMAAAESGMSCGSPFLVRAPDR